MFSRSQIQATRPKEKKLVTLRYKHPGTFLALKSVFFKFPFRYELLHANHHELDESLCEWNSSNETNPLFMNELWKKRVECISTERAMSEWADYSSKPLNQPTRVRNGNRGTESPRSGKTTVTRPDGNFLFPLSLLSWRSWAWSWSMSWSCISRKGLWSVWSQVCLIIVVVAPDPRVILVGICFFKNYNCPCRKKVRKRRGFTDFD